MTAILHFLQHTKTLGNTFSNIFFDENEEKGFSFLFCLATEEEYRLFKKSINKPFQSLLIGEKLFSSLDKGPVVFNLSKELLKN